MKTILAAIGILVVGGCAVGFLLTYHALGNAESDLDAARADVADLQDSLQDARSDLSETRDELQVTTDNLANFQSVLDEQKNETAGYIDLYESTQKELDRTSGLLESTQEENEDLQEEINEIQVKLDLYEDTLGTQVFSGVNPPYVSGDATELILTDNSNATDPTWQELEAFLLEDKTDKNLYVTGEYECGNFAEELHNNAEAAGIRAAFVGIHYYDDLPHAINAFKTTDQGLVYVDVTGSKTQISLLNIDKKAVVAKDEIYQCTLIFPQSPWYIPPDDRIVQSIEIYW